MIEQIKKLGGVFLDYNTYNLFCSYLDTENYDKARSILLKYREKIDSALINAHYYNMEQVISFQYVNLLEADLLLTELLIQQSELTKARKIKIN